MNENILTPIIPGYQLVQTKTALPASGAWTQICKRTSNRWHLIIIGPATGVTYWPGGPGPNPGSFAIISAGQYLEWKFKDAPLLTTIDWYASATGSQTITCIETIFQKG